MALCSRSKLLSAELVGIALCSQDGERFLSSVAVVPVARPGHAPAQLGDGPLLQRVPELSSVSSTSVRAAIRRGDWAEADHALQPAVLSYLKEHQLYSS